MAKLTVISSQRFLDESIVLQKMARVERWIHLSPPFLHDGALKSVLLDGHHNLEASKRLTEIPNLDFVFDEDDACSIDLLLEGEIDWFLEWNKGDDEYFEIYHLEGDFEAVN